jgi:Putative Ig domain
VQGGLGADIWSIAKGTLPAGLKLDRSTGFISGKPARRGHYVFYLTTKDELGASRSLKISIAIRP